MSASAKDYFSKGDCKLGCVPMQFWIFGNTKSQVTYQKSGTRDPGPQYDQVGPETREPLSGTRDPQIFKWEPGPGNPEVGR